MNSSDWKTQYRIEIEQANSARRAGNEGKARVCARRAAGIVIGEYISQNGLADSGSSAYSRLKYLVSLPQIPSEIRDSANYFLIHVNENHQLPIDVDLIAEAEWLKIQLINDQDPIMTDSYKVIYELKNEIGEIPDDSIISKTIQNDDDIKVVLFGFSENQELSEHTAAMPAIIEIIEGEMTIQLAGEIITGKPSTWIHMPANLPHSLTAKSRSLMLLTLLKS